MYDQLERYRWLIVAIFAVPLLSGIGFLLNERLRDDPALVVISESEVRVYVSGSVVNPGVYTLQDGDRWIDAIAAAGGFSGDANQNGVNLARRVRDEDQILVPTLGGGLVAGASQGPIVNINTASQAQLEELPGIGETRAADIIASRTADGPFTSPDDLLTRELIPESVFEDIEPFIIVGP